MNPIDPMDLFDTHFHLSHDDDLDAIVTRAAAAGVSRLLVAGAPIEQTPHMLKRIAAYKNVWAAAGVHPHDAGEFDGNEKPFRSYLAHKKVVAVGEIGLDYHYDFSPPDIQRRVFRAFLELAVTAELPAVVHCRNAFDDCYQILADVFRCDRPFVIHCFTGSCEWARKFIDMGGYVSFNGIMTFNKSDDIRDVMKRAPVDRILFETDAPYLAPVPKRGKKNEPSYLPFIIERAAHELGIDKDELAHITTANADRFFAIPG